MRRSLPVMLSLVFVVGILTGCNRPSQPSGPQGGAAVGGTERLLIAVIPKSNGGEFWETVETGARQAAADLDVEIKWEGTLTETEIAEQNKIIENMINLGVDGMALAPLNRGHAKTGPKRGGRRDSRGDLRFGRGGRRPRQFRCHP